MVEEGKEDVAALLLPLALSLCCRKMGNGKTHSMLARKMSSPGANVTATWQSPSNIFAFCNIFESVVNFTAEWRVFS